MQVESTKASEPQEVQFTHEEWGDNKIVSHWGEEKWIMYDPESDTATLEDWL